MAARRKEWSEEEEKDLFKLHQECGNKWSIISTKMPGRDDSSIKNKFYSTLRKGLRKINKYITNIKKKSDPAKFKAFKPFQELFLTKIIAVADQNYEQKFEVRPRALDLAASIQSKMVQIACSEKQYLKLQMQDYPMEEDLLIDIQQFNKNCKKRKGKRKQLGSKGSSSENDSFQQIQLKQEASEIVQEDHKVEEKIICEEVKQEVCQGNEHPLTKQNIILTNQQSRENQTEQKQKMFSNFANFDKKGLDEVPLAKKPNYAPTVITNDSILFASKTEEFFKVAQDISLVQSSNLSMSNSWMFDSSNFYDKNMTHFLIQPSPNASANRSFNLNNLIRTKNSSFDGKDSADLFSSGKMFSNKQEDNVISLVDHLPLYECNISSIALRSADLQQSTEFAKMGDPQYPISSSAPFDQRPSSLVDQFLLGFSYPSTFRGYADLLMKDYTFGSSNEVTNLKEDGEDEGKQVSFARRVQQSEPQR